MFEETIQLRVRYHDCDPMGIVYHGHYAKLFEIGRTEAMRKHGFSYQILEQQGFAMPVVEMNIKYLRPARYDELIDIKTIIEEIPNRFLIVKGIIFNQDKKVLTESIFKFVFVKRETLRRCSPPVFILEQIKPYF